MALLIVLIFSMFLANVAADYECLCSYKIEMPVNTAANRDSGVLGYLYEFDCKPTVKVPGGPKQNWQTIAYEQQVGYVFVDSQISTQVCPGNPSIEDKLTTHTYPTTTTIPTSTSTKQTTPQTTTSTKATTSTTRTTTLESTTHPTTTTKTTSTTKPTMTRPSTTSTEKTSTSNTSTTTTATTTIKLTTAPPTAPVMLGDVRSCPHTLHQYTIEDKGALGKFGNSCYEIVPIRTTWLKAENDCTAKGGHLFHISNQREQDFILLFINSNQFAHACWMGLNDIISEETFDWISGDGLTYTNWWHDRKGNFFSHHMEDCVLFVPYSPYFGKWDDAPCGSTNIFGTDQGQINPFICQFSIHSHYTYVPLSSVVGKRQTRGT